MYDYTICFIRRGNQVLLLNRERPSWMGSWNGVGGRLEPGEDPTACVLREVFEETAIRLDNVRYRGVVTWVVDGKPIGGMYAFVALLPDDYVYQTPVGTKEGILDWKTIDWILHPKNTGIAANVPWFLPRMLSEDGLYEHKCVFNGKTLVTVESSRLASK